ncbi:hypothetical protein F5B22DRAFT_643151 [Xylaria bambusicola]|uniref:uncharacterized protein n=1 Tax=Xylaria bambusicola TaxID=326684 RepID=UPI002007A721|nr:uncharacterized protein F5B22DRAFT_643151 [Xylaria bambusicola]KAI0522128.1 hypothetical protein F5B22DRAFT_643151 [Xylaria bambusicola]
MPFLEIAQPKLKKDSTLVKHVEEHLAPQLSAKLQHSGVLNGTRGFLVTENGRDVRDEYRDIVFLEWPSRQHLRDFAASPELAEHKEKMKPYIDGPTNVKLFEIDNDDISSFFGADAVVEYLAIKPNDTSEAGVQSVLQYLQSGLSQLGSAKALVGGSCNLETREIAVVSIYASDADLNAAKAAAARQQLLAELAKTVSTTSLVAHVKKVIPLGEK